LPVYASGSDVSLGDTSKSAPGAEVL